MTTTTVISIKIFLDFLFNQFHFDVRNFSKPSLLRRINLILSKFNLKDLSELQSSLKKNPSLFEKIFPLFLISTTEMFRHPLFFKEFQREVIPYLKTFSRFRIWVAGCSTGEELFSYIILLHEAGILHRGTIYATDLNANNLESAKKGLIQTKNLPFYSANYLAGGGSKKLSEYFNVVNEKAFLDEALLRNVCFSDHCLITDKSFSEFQFISCRNVLIYFDTTLQDKVIKLLLDSLYPHGYLGLGSKENIRFSIHRANFDFSDRERTIYRRKLSLLEKDA